MADKKMTKREMFTALIGYLEVAPANMDATPEGLDPEDFLNDAIAFCHNEISLLDRKHSKSGGKTKNQLLNDVIKDDIAIALEDAGAPMKATAISKVVAGDYPVQKISALLRQMVAVGRVTREEKGKETFFTLA